MGEKLKVGFIYGGRSGEHEVSLQTALSVLQAFDYDKYEIKPFYITKQGEWLTSDFLPAAPASVDELQFRNPQTIAAPAITSLFDGISTAAGTNLDVVFPLLHGTFGEDGTIQGLLEIANLPYVGAGVLTSAVGMDKIIMKKVFAQEGLPQCVYRYFNRTQWEKDPGFFIMEIEISIGYPCFVKPANLGSSVGISKARNREELQAAVAYALRFDRKVIVEEFVDAREIEVSVLGNDEPRVSIPGEIISSGDFYDYQAKYVDGKSVIQIPAQLSLETAETVRSLALRAYLAIDGSGLSRMDFFLRKEDGKLFINEVNTMPGFTPFSMYPLMWKESGVAYKDLLDTLITLALERHAAKQQLQYSS
ncbi:D-alanine--D-alanine ligase [Paenibacillus sp. GCM10012307]|uniref:D-alanine--D-alanine ligase n=1 Tax=Paenibacillus roseus TaxID=2798579 RepID=A0A934J6T2_9BACL|nr:D-alanine--D-alanine ligase [Paenibacillus roseus]MBJ6362794.1 D-alanine--D-alanine ligase [Paenibacillus roseus]